MILINLPIQNKAEKFVVPLLDLTTAQIKLTKTDIKKLSVASKKKTTQM